MAAVYKQGNKFMLDVTLYGKRKRKTLHAATQEEAEIEAASILAGNIEQLHKIERHQIYRRPDIQNLHWKAKTHAVQRRIDWNLSLEELIELFNECGQRCSVTGIPFDLNYKPEGATKRPFCASIDRIDNRLGYHKENCRLVCTIVNVAMGEWGFEALQTVSNALALRTKQPNLRVA